MSPNEGGRRLLIVSDTLAGGTGGAVLGHSEWFGDRGWQVEVAAPADESQAVRVPGHRPLPVPASARHAAGVLGAARCLRHVVATSRPDIVHCHGARSFAVARAANPTRAPFVTLHSISPVSSDPPGYGGLRRAALAVLPRLAARAFAARPDAPRGWEFLPHASPRLTTLAQLPPPTAPVPTFLWIGRLDEPKRPDLFVAAIAALARVRPDVQGLMAGTGPLQPAVARQIATTGAPVELLGHVGDLAGPLLRAWAVVLFSDAEGVNFSLEEAMWAGRGVVGSAIPGTAWLVGPDGEGGALVGTVDDAVSVLVELCQLDRAGDLGARAAGRIRRLLSPDDPWPAVERAYQDHLSLVPERSPTDPDER